MNKKTVDEFEKLYVQLVGVKAELDLLSKKAPNDAINKFKLQFINQLIESANKLLKPTYLPFASFSIFDSENMPSNSDGVFILNQYIKCLNKLKFDNVKSSMGQWYWQIDDGSQLKTSHPSLDLIS